MTPREQAEQVAKELRCEVHRWASSNDTGPCIFANEYWCQPCRAYRALRDLLSLLIAAEGRIATLAAAARESAGAAEYTLENYRAERMLRVAAEGERDRLRAQQQQHNDADLANCRCYECVDGARLLNQCVIRTQRSRADAAEAALVAERHLRKQAAGLVELWKGRTEHWKQASLAAHRDGNHQLGAYCEGEAMAFTECALDASDLLGGPVQQTATKTDDDLARVDESNCLTASGNDRGEERGDS